MLRKSCKLTQEQVAEKLCLSRPTYSRYEKDGIEMNLSQLYKVSEIYKIPFSELLEMIRKENNHQELNISTLEFQELVLLLKEHLFLLKS